METNIIRIKDSALVRTRQAEIVEAARLVFRDKGFHGATVREIGAAARMTQGTLYNYVRSKEEILFLVCDQLVRAYQESVKSAIASETRPGERLSAALRAIVEVMQDHQGDLLLMYQESHALDRKGLREVLGRVRDFIEYFAEILEEASDAGLISCPKPMLTANFITFLPAIVALRRWDLDRHFTREEVADNLVDFMTRALGIESGEPKVRS
jgi:AcrR family transcriptional regulator